MKKKIYIILAAVVAIIAAWLVLFPGKNPLSVLKGSTTGSGTTPGTTATGSSGTSATEAGFPIEQNVSIVDQRVKDVQLTLNRVFGSTLDVDGKFGPKTLKALKAFGFAANDNISYSEYKELMDYNIFE